MRRRGTRQWLAAALVGSALLAAVAPGVAQAGAATTHPATTKTITVGVLTDATGLGASEMGTSTQGVKAGIGVASKEGYHIKYVVADTGTNPAQVLTAAQKLVEQDHVFAVLALSSLTFGASDYLTSKGIPVIGGSFDGSEWLKPTSTNMFSVIGNEDFTKVTSTAGLFLKSQGVTNVGTLGYSISPSSAAAARSAAASAKLQGIKAGYVNDSFPFGGTNVAPVALAMKSAGVNGIVLDVDPNTAFALVHALKNEGVHLKTALLATGYGGDILNGGHATIQAAQGDSFLSNFEPNEQNTPATNQIKNALAQYAHVHTDPTFAEYMGYLSVDGLVQGLKGAGKNPTQHSLITALSHITKYQAAGLWGGHQTVDWSKRPMGTTQCYWVTKLSGTKFAPIANSAPVCGQIVPGQSV